MPSAYRLLVVVVVVVSGVVAAAAATPTKPEELGVTIPGIGRYYLNQNLLNWTQAHTACKMIDGYLAVFETHYQAFAVKDIMSTYGVLDVHIGVHDLYEERNYVTVLDQPLGKMGFQGGAPNNTGVTSSNCGIYRNGVYAFDVCATRRASVCQLRIWDEYTRVGTHGYYKVHTALRTWAEAWATCRAEDADLLVLRSFDERDAVFTAFHAQLLQRTFHYGAHHRHENQRFYTIFDEPLNWSGFAEWLPGLPDGLNNVAAPYLGILFNDVEQRGLTAGNATNLLPFICKHDLHRP